MGGDERSASKRLIATIKNRPGKPQLKVEFSDWNLAAR
jgi:hypothetical protein